MAPPSPFSIGRFHSHQVNTLYFSLDNERLYSGDSEGNVVCTLTRTFRPLVTWRAHQAGVLTIAEWAQRIVTHGRDNKLHVWDQVASLPTVSDTAVASTSAPTTPSLVYTLDVNALNFCRFSLLLLPSSWTRKEDDCEVFVAVPHLVDSGLTDIWALPSLARIHAAVGKAQAQGPPQPDGRGASGSGILMANHLYLQDIPGKKTKPQLRLLSAYEAGHVTLFARTDTFLDRSVEGKSWETLWTMKAHVESVMSLTVSSDQTFALTISADHLIGKYSLLDNLPDGLERMAIHRIKQSGHSAVALRNDDRVCAVAGWDGKTRLFSTKSFKPLGTLTYHNEAAYAVTFANKSQVSSSGADQEDDSEDGWEYKDSQRRERWLVSAGKEGRVAFWELSSFEK